MKQQKRFLRVTEVLGVTKTECNNFLLKCKIIPEHGIKSDTIEYVFRTELEAKSVKKGDFLVL